MQLSQHIPRGFFSDLFKKSLVEVLFYKFYLQYLLIEPRDGVDQDDHRMINECSNSKFSVFKLKLWSVIAFKRVYILNWIVINGTVDMFVFMVSSNFDMVLLTAILIEALRRLLKV